MRSESSERWRGIVARPVEIDQFQPISAAHDVEVAARSACGSARTHNTDHYLAVRFSRSQETIATSLTAADLPPRFEEHAYAMVVADGLGEPGAGTRASRVALSALAHLAVRYGRWNVRIHPDTPADIAEQGDFLYREVNDAVIRASRADPQFANMATSLTAVYLAEDYLFFAHIGHSKAFLFRDGVLTQLTTDHTLQQQRRESLRPLAVDHIRQDQGHSVTEVIGGRTAGDDVEIEHVRLLSADRLLLCTNGLTDVVREDQIADTLALQRRPHEDCERLIELTRAAGIPDDVTVVVADYRIHSAVEPTASDGRVPA
jgi:serine/threonine protein phosphatase PrpC